MSTVGELMLSFVKHISPLLGRKMKIFGFAWGELTLDDTMHMTFR